MERRRRTFALRSVEVRRHLDIFLVCAAAAVLGNRTFLVITGYPQIGNSSLHISHAIWGALMMASAVVVAVAYLPPYTRTFVSFLGGAGFGWFIDEVGKFISRDTNYFFQPAIAVIYITFIAMFFVFRSLKGSGFGPDEAVLNALEALKSASIGRLDETRRTETLTLLDQTGASGAIADRTAELLRDVPALPPREPGPFERFGRWARSWYDRFAERRVFTTIVSAILVVIAITKVVAVASLVQDGPGVHGFSEWASLVSSIVAGTFIVVGAIRLPRSRLGAYTWFERGLLVDILVTQVFVFDQEQLYGVLGLAITIVLWAMVRTAMRAERERAVTAASMAVGGDSASRVSTAAP